jgi:hypothetical protein
LTMNPKLISNLKAIVFTIIVICISLTFQSLPWWSFAVPVVGVGIILAYLKWPVSGFTPGFWAGFIIWSLSSLYFDLTGNGIVLGKLAQMFYSNKLLLILASGLIGGLLSGLATYAGMRMFTHKEEDQVDNFPI